MEWNRGPGQTQPANQPVNQASVAHQSVNHAAAARKKKLSFLSLRAASVGLVICIAILVLALAGSIAIGGPVSQSKYVDSSKMQAVFLNGGQVYFGKIYNLNDRFMRIGEIYYLRVNQTVQPNGNTAAGQDISLVKLGCELHGPQDTMVINQDQVIFWENLKDDGQVTKAVADYKKQNPNGQKCETAPAASNNNSSTTPAATTPAATTPATTKKP